MTLDESMTEVVMHGWHHSRTVSRVDWCTEHIGPYGRGWFYVWNDEDEGEKSTWYFTDPKNATMFALRFII